MSDNSANSKRIAKNTLMLYFRMLLLMGVSLYTSRVVLSVLGVEDYGIYNVVGGLVAMFTMISGSLSAAISRYITVELGKGNQEKLNKIFSTAITIQLIISAVVVILAETAGVWFLANKMTIPIERLVAAKWVFQVSLVTFVINLISIPYRAAIIAHERMSAFAYISIFEAFGKLGVVYLIAITSFDRLIFYAILLAVISLVVRLIYSIYCRHNFEECRSKWFFEKDLLKEMFGFAGWNFIGVIAFSLRDQGGNVLLNLFGGPAINAAKGIAGQVTTAVTQFSSNFMMALNPQITKSYASGNKEYMMTLIFQGARLSFYMLLLLSLPILMSTSYILTLWLSIVPEHTILFVQLSLIVGMMEAISHPLMTAAQATGKIKTYQIIVGGLCILNFPLAYFMLRLGFFYEIVLCVSMFISICSLFARLIMLRGMIGLSVRKFFNNVIVNLLFVSMLAAIIPFIISRYMEVNFLSFILLSLTTLISTIIAIYFVGCNKVERQFVSSKIIQFISKVTSKQIK